MKRSVHCPTKKELIQGILWTAFVLFLLFGAAFLCSVTAQTVVRKGNTFYQQPSKKTIKKDSSVTLTQFTYVIKDVKYPVYKSSKNKYFIIRISKNGKQYRKYITKEICGSKDNV